MALALGTRLGRYEITAQIGLGGMGEVYRARDVRLQRDVAVKLLPREFWNNPDRLRRFEGEARATAALSHPNILSVYDIGTADGVPYFVCELLAGETLRLRLSRGPLPIDQVADYAAKIARGLAAAHDRGIVHRDLKPDNLFITTDGQLKILDFGIAKASAVGSERGEQETVTSAITTEPLSILGTLPYMSPEQIRGAPVDGRSDIFSLGAVLFEMLTARPAFGAPSTAETMSAILTADPLSHLETLGVDANSSPALIQVARHCLEKDPKQRFQSARDVALGLEVVSGVRPATPTSTIRWPNRRWLWMAVAVATMVAVVLALGLLRQRNASSGEPASKDITTLAALPLTNISANPEDEYFTDGMTDSLITDLARVERLGVMARAAVFRFKDRTIDPQKVGQELAVRYVLHGSVQRSGDKVRVNVRLLDVATGYNVWAESFEEYVRDVFVIQNRISSRVVEALALTLSPANARRSARRPTANDQAYDTYLQGLYYSHKPGKDNRERALSFLERTVDADPQFALAQAAMGSAYTQRFFYDDADPQWERRAFVAIEKALAVDADLAEAYLARGQLAWSLPNGFPHERAIRDLQRAIAIKPSLVDAHRELGKIYMHIGLLDKAIAANKQTLQLDPGDRAALGRAALSHLYLRECQTALEITARGGLRRPHAEALACLGRADAALQEVSDIAVTEPGEATAAGLHAMLLARKGNGKAARQMIAGLRLKAENVAELSDLHHAQYYIGAAYALLGDTRQAVLWLKKASREGLPCYPLFERDPNLAGLRQDPEFAAFMQELKAQTERFRSTL
jgi:serine/threonine protein kinase/tetratricopeptide (TPR) repeat protein